jgi:hypothetical protein
MSPPAQERERLRGLDEADRPARRGAELDQRRHLVEPVAVRPPGRVGQRDREADHVAVDEHPLRRRARVLQIGERQPLTGDGRRADRAADDRGLLAHARVVHEQLEEEAVDLRLGQRVGAF